MEPQSEYRPILSVLDSDAALESCAGDPALLCEVAGLFIKDAPERLERLRVAGAQRDGHALAMAAHALKGSAVTFGARIAAQAAGCVERLVLTGAIDEAVIVAMVLDCEILRLVDALDQLTRAGNPPAVRH
jgi:HPt (histidine-containing phosphotransfer) domain-containing protein